MESGMRNYIKLPKVTFEDNYPLVVDLDYALLKTDLLYEGLIMLLRKNPMYIFNCLVWAIKGKAYLKNEVFKIVHLHYELLPYNTQLLHFLHKESSNGRKIILVTHSARQHAVEIARIHPIFNNIYGTGKANLKSGNKLEIVIDYFGESKFDYVGDSRSDREIFASSRYSYLVNSSKSLEKKTEKVSDLKHIWRSQGIRLSDYAKVMGVNQWMKNLLIFIPLITVSSLNSFALVWQLAAAFFAFSFATSSGHVLNDLLHLNADRVHPRKRIRLFASGKLPVLHGIIMASVLFAAGLCLASQLSSLFLVIFIIYIIVSFSHSLYCRKTILPGVFLLCVLHSSLVIAGSVAINISISLWLIVFCALLFSGVAFVKKTLLDVYNW